MAVPNPERTAALNDLAAALLALGDDASKAAQSSRDVRLHVVACQAEHLAADVLDLLPHGPTDDVLPEGRGLASSANAAREAFHEPAARPLPQSLAASLGWLLDLAEAAAA
ncbi:hypothetical protein N801_10020 [Knoellia aerolata DSM 18566]|uniref:Uncharacterized protein n=1 Tax=Knoellia aerolata DSM 18566 TaxID=1385519 RepID=A0A0A0JUJ5_9MICO|nr:hypothetical protein N801_10020 [Knoellia aerolata DSM 18566]